MQYKHRRYLCVLGWHNATAPNTGVDSHNAFRTAIASTIRDVEETISTNRMLVMGAWILTAAFNIICMATTMEPCADLVWIEGNPWDVWETEIFDKAIITTIRAANISRISTDANSADVLMTALTVAAIWVFMVMHQEWTVGLSRERIQNAAAVGLSEANHRYPPWTMASHKQGMVATIVDNNSNNHCWK